ncbi:hypothetical protein RJ639_007153 [Escallonia herrerae]|uniref:Homeobox domain-containing protein n=1 Tax=Escallonia herrerae TaxID=1293975 RepID=A0AA89AW00_9ASTE|nr:hypothetical protein RJ639_007153 [Escallonia herrerae]
MGYGDICHTGLSLGLSSCDTSNQQKKSSSKSGPFFPCLTLSLSPEGRYQAAATKETNPYQRGTTSLTELSSFSNSSVKRERDASTGEEVEDEEERVLSKEISDDQDEEGACARKKLRLTKEQSATLEDSFKEHSTLNPKQKQALANRLNLRPRQVEVWFQNRRARTKLKQTEVDCELLKKCCETLTDENRRLQKELQELRAIKLTAPVYMQLSAATLTMCPSCERIAGGVGDNSSKSPFSINGTKSHFYSSFTHPSAAC